MENKVGGGGVVEVSGIPFAFAIHAMPFQPPPTTALQWSFPLSTPLILLLARSTPRPTPEKCRQFFENLSASLAGIMRTGDFPESAC